MRIKANGIEMNYESSGEGDPLVLVHGFSDNRNMWWNQVREFSGHYRVLTYDVRGFGQSERPRTGYSMDLFAEDLFELLCALKVQRAFVLGYSMGGGIGLRFALQHPEMAKGLILANSGVVTPDLRLPPEQVAEIEERRKMMMALVTTGDITRIAEVMTELSLTPGFKERAPEVFERYREVKGQNDPSTYGEILGALFASMAHPPDLGRLGCPALIIAGKEDRFMTLEIARAMEKAIPRATLRILPTGHAAAIEAPAAFNEAVLDFLKTL